MKKKLVCLLLSLLMLATMLPVAAIAETPTQEPPAAADPVAEPEGDPAPAADPIQVTVGEEQKQEEEQQVEDQQNEDQKDDREGVPSVGSSDDLDKEEEQEKEQEEEQQDDQLQEEVKEEEPEEQKEEGKEEEPEKQKEEADALQEEEKEEPQKDDGEEQDGESAAPVEYSVAFRVNGETVTVSVPAGERIGESMPAEPVLGDEYIFEGWFDENGNWVDAWTEVNGPMTVTARFMYLPAGSDSASAGGITVTAAWNAGVFPEGTQLTIDPRGRDKALAMAENALPEGYEAVDGEAVDITFIADGVSVQPYYGSVSVSITLARTLEGEIFHVLHERKNQSQTQGVKGMRNTKSSGSGNVETVSASVRATGATFSGGSFSIYAIVGSTEHPSLIQARRTYQFYAGEPTADRSGWPKVFEAIYTDGDTLEVPEAPGGDSKHRFSGWYVYENGAYTTTQVMAGPVDLSGLTEDDTVQVYAKFDQQYKVTLYTDETMTAVFDTILALDGETVTLPSPAEAEAAGLIIPAYKKMLGWKYPGASGASVANDEVTISGQDIDLVPEMSDAHLVKFELVKEAFQAFSIPDQRVLNGEKVIEPNFVMGQTYRGYTFGGWYLSENYHPEATDPSDTFTGAPFDFNTPLEQTDPAFITLYAKWTPATTVYTVKAYREKQNALSYELGDTVALSGLTDEELSLSDILAAFPNDKYSSTASGVGYCHWSGTGALDEQGVNAIVGADGKVLPVIQVLDKDGAVVAEAKYNPDNGQVEWVDNKPGTISGDGDTVVRVNYNRHRYVLHFLFQSINGLSINTNSPYYKYKGGISGSTRLQSGGDWENYAPTVTEPGSAPREWTADDDMPSMIIKYAQHLYKVTHLVYDYGWLFDPFMAQSPWFFRKYDIYDGNGQTVFDSTNQSFPVKPLGQYLPDGTEIAIGVYVRSGQQTLVRHYYYYDSALSWEDIYDSETKTFKMSPTRIETNKTTYISVDSWPGDIGNVGNDYTVVAITGHDAYKLNKTGSWRYTTDPVTIPGTHTFRLVYADGETESNPLCYHNVPSPHTITFKQTSNTDMVNRVNKVNGWLVSDDTFEEDVVVSNILYKSDITQIIQDNVPDWTTLKDDQGRVYQPDGGWYGDTKADGSFPTTMPGKDLVFYRKWKTDTYIVTFDLNGYTVDGEQIHHHDGVLWGENIGEFPELAAYTARDGWVFLRWTAFERNADGTKGAPIDGYTPNTPIDRDYYLVAQWAKEVPYTVEYREGDHGQFSADLTALLVNGKDPMTYIGGNDASVKGVAEGAAVDGVQYVFIGWRIGGSGALVTGGDTFEISDDNDRADGGAADQNIVLVAQYEPLTPPRVGITYHANYPSKAEPTPETIPSVTVMNGTYTIDKNAESYSWSETGYRFVCWSNEAAAKIFDPSPSRPYEYFYEGEIIALGQGNDNDLYAVWEPFDEPTITVTVKKVWDDEDDTNRKRSGVEAKFVLQKTVNGVSVQVDAVTVEKTQHWTYTWSALPAFEGNQQVTYSVKEDLIVANGYQSDTVAWKTVSDGQTITITNKYRVKDDTPPTGDTTKTVLWASLMLVSAFGCVGALLLAPRKRWIWR